MKMIRSNWMKLLAGLFILACLLLLAVPGAQANVRTDDMVLPAYARIERGFAIHTGDWAAIVFYRPTGCVPDDFNLLDFFDMNALGCTPQTMDGFVIWSGEPWITPPIQMRFQGLGAMPVWFVSWPELEEAIADDILTIVELEGMPSLMTGTASFYSETLHPYDPTMVVMNPMIEYVARGWLEDGRSFAVHALAITPYQNGKWIDKISITFR